MRLGRPTPTILAACLALQFASLPARADQAADAAAAQSLYDEGRRLMDEKKFAEACPKLESSQRLDPGIGTQFHLADCYEKVGRSASSWALFLEVASAARARGKTDQEQIARDRAKALSAKLSKLTVKLQGTAVSGLVIKRGNAVVESGLLGTPVAVDPGKYTVTASAPGKQAFSAEVSVGANGDSKVVTIPELADAGGAAATPGGTSDTTAAPAASDEAPGDTGTTPMSASSGLRIGSYVALGVGVVGVGLGTVFALKSKGKRSDADKLTDECGSGCLASDPRAAEISSLDDDARSAKTMATIGFVVGGVGLATGVTLFLLSGHKGKSETARTTQIQPWVGLGSAGVRGSF
jgi:hypothetical protein